VLPPYHNDYGLEFVVSDNGAGIWIRYLQYGDGHATQGPADFFLPEKLGI
jgi:hypothetical protein